MSWPLLFLPCQHRDLSTWPCLSCRLRAAPLAFHMERAPSPSAQPRRDFPALKLHSIHKKKKNLDLKTCEHIIRKKVSWKNVVRMSKGLGHRKWLRPPPSPHPHTCQLGSLSICCVGFQAQGCRSAEGLGALRHRSKEIQRKRLITNHAILFSRPGAGCCWTGCPLCEPTRLYPTSHVPPTGLRPPTGAFFVTHFLSHNGIA